MEAKLFDRVTWSYGDDEILSGFVIGKITGHADVSVEFVDLLTRRERTIPATVYLVTVEERTSTRSNNKSYQGQNPVALKEDGNNLANAIGHELSIIGNQFQQRFLRATESISIAREITRILEPNQITKVEDSSDEEFYTSKVPLTQFLGRYRIMIESLKELEGQLEVVDFVDRLKRSLALFSPGKVESIVSIIDCVPNNKQKLETVFKALDLLY